MGFQITMRKPNCVALMIWVWLFSVLVFVRHTSCAEISVQVFMPDKQTPAANASVILSSPDGNLREHIGLPLQKNADKDGRCRFEGLPEGEYAVRATLGNELIATQSTRLVAPNQRIGVWLTLSHAASNATGTIIAIVTDNPARAINNLVLVLRKRGVNELEQKVIDEFGMLIWSGLEPGEYEAAWVTSQMAKYLARAPRTQLPNPFIITIEANKVLKLNIEGARSGAITPIPGPIQQRPEAMPFEGLFAIKGVAQDENGNPISKALIQIQGAQFAAQEGLMRSIPLFGAANTNEQGQFEIAIPFATLMPLIRMEPAADEFKPLKGVLLLRLVMFGAQPKVATERVEITLPSIAELRKSITKAVIGDAVGIPPKPVAIELGKVKFALRQMPTAKLKLIDALTKMPIANRKFTIRIILVDGGRETGRRPIEPTIVEADENGTVIVPTEGAGRYFVRVEGDGYRQADLTVQLEPGGETTVMLRPVGTASGRVMIQLREDMQPLPLPNARLRFRFIPENEFGEGIQLTITTDAEGRYKAVNVPAGRVRIEVSCWLYAPISIDNILIKPAEITEGVDIVIKPIPVDRREER